MPIVKMPDGTQVRFPDDMPREQIRSLIASKFPEAAAQAAPAPAADFDPMRDLPLPGTSHPTAPDNSYHSPIPGADAINEFASSFAENIPILGPATTRAADSTGSQIAAMISGRPAGDLNQEVQQVRQDERAENPMAATAGAVTGSVGPLMALGATQAGGQALGNTGPLLQRMFAGGASGGVISGGDALARGDDLGTAATKAALGVGIGSVLPMAERAASPIFRMLMGQNVSAPVQSIARNLERDGIDPATMASQLDAIGPEAVPMDLGANMTRQAGAIASLPGEGQTILRDALTARNTGTNSRIQSGVNDTLGAAPVPSRVQGEIRSNQQALGPEYEDAFRQATAVDTSALALDLDSMAVNLRGDAQRAVQRVRSMLDVTGNPGNLDPNPYTLFQTRQAIDGMMDGMTDGNAIRALSNARRQVDDMLAQSVPGIKQVDAKYAELARQEEAFTQGRRTLTGGDGAEHPADVVEQMMGGAIPQAQMSGPSAVPFRLSQGARAQIDQIIGTTANDLQGLRRAVGGSGDWNRDKLVATFGARKADELLGILDRELRYQRGFNAVTGNSETAARTAAQKEAAPHQFGSTSTSLADLLLKIPQGLANAGARGRSEATNRQIAELLTGRPSPDLIDQLMLAQRGNRGLIGSAPAPMLTNQ